MHGQSLTTFLTRTVLIILFCFGFGPCSRQKDNYTLSNFTFTFLYLFFIFKIKDNTDGPLLHPLSLLLPFVMFSRRKISTTTTTNNHISQKQITKQRSFLFLYIHCGQKYIGKTDYLHLHLRKVRSSSPPTSIFTFDCTSTLIPFHLQRKLDFVKQEALEKIQSTKVFRGTNVLSESISSFFVVDFHRLHILPLLPLP